MANLEYKSIQRAYVDIIESSPTYLQTVAVYDVYEINSDEQTTQFKFTTSNYSDAETYATKAKEVLILNTAALQQLDTSLKVD